MNILHLLSNHCYTGPAEPVIRLARAQLAAGHRVRLAIDRLREGDLPGRAAAAGIELDERLLLSVKAGLAGQWADLRALRRIWRAAEYDLLHCHKSHEHSLALLARPRRARPRLVRTLNRLRPPAGLRRWQLRRTDGLVAVASGQAAELVARGGIDQRRIALVGGVVDCQAFAPGDDGAALRGELGIDPEAPVAGIVSRIKPGRGHELLLDSWSRVHRELPAARLIVSGRGELSERIQRRARAPGFGGSVVVLGYQQDLARLYRALDAKVILAPGNDGTCRAALEAMACARPVVAPRLGALGDIVLDGRTGLLVEPLEPETLAGRLVEALADRAGLARMGAAARDRAEREYTIERHWERIERLYRTLLQPEAGGSA